MKPLVALAATVLAVSLQTAFVRTSSAQDCSNLPDSGGWVLFADSNRGVPDFWTQDSLDVQQIAICPNGVSFLFLATEGGSLYLAALVFVNPLGMLWRFGGSRTPSDFGLEYYEGRYSTLLEDLEHIAGGVLEPGDRIDFRMLSPSERPRIVDPSRRLLLRWKNQEVQLRGYLDVYFDAFS